MARRLHVVLLFVAVSAAPWSVAYADDALTARPITLSASAAALAVLADASQSGAQIPRELPAVPGRSWTTPVMIAMQAATMATQALDIHSTMKALNAGAVEANPLMGGVVKNKAAFIGVKAAVGAGLMLATHKMAKRNKVAAILTSAAVNSAYLFVAHHNYKVASGLR